MAHKRLDRIEIVLHKNISTGDSSGSVSAVCYSEDLEAGFGVSLPLAGIDAILDNAIDALKTHMSQDGKHEVIDCPPPPAVEEPVEEE